MAIVLTLILINPESQVRWELVEPDMVNSIGKKISFVMRTSKMDKINRFAQKNVIFFATACLLWIVNFVGLFTKKQGYKR